MTKQEIGEEIIPLNQEIGSTRAAKEVESGLWEQRELKCDTQVSALVFLLMVVFSKV